MANIQKIDSEVSDFIGFLHNAPEVKPFLEDIYLITVNVAGLVYIDDIDEIFSIIKEGDHLDLFREKDNRYDEHAILVKYDGKKIGYVPRADNIILANLMDAGKMLYGVVVDTYIEYVYVGDEFKVVKFKIFLKE